MISPETDKPKVLIADDNQELAACLHDMIDIFGISCDITNNAANAMTLLKKESYSLIFIDTNIPRICGQMLHIHVKRDFPDVLVALMSAYDSTNTNRMVVRDRPDFYLAKPFRISELEKILDEIKSKPEAV